MNLTAKKTLILFAIFFMQITKQDCSYGCLACSENQTCLICDIENQYILKNG